MIVKVNVNATSARVLVSPHPLTERLVGLLCQAAYSSEWDGLIKNVVVRSVRGSASVTERVLLNVGDTFEIPHEPFADSGCKIEIGFEGRNGTGTLVIPTEWAYLGKLTTAVDDSVQEGIDPTPTQAEQLLRQINGKASTESVFDLTETVAELDDDIGHFAVIVEEEIARAKLAEKNLADNGLELKKEIQKKQNKLNPGKNITIEDDGTISADCGGGGGAVNSVNGKTGDVVLSASDVHALPDTTVIPDAPDVNKAYVDEADSALDNRVTELEQRPLTSGVSALTINGKELPNEDGVVAIPTASSSNEGTVRIDNYYGMQMGTGGSSNVIMPIYANNANIDSRSARRAIPSNVIDYAVCASLTDGKSASLWTTDKQQAARALLGISIWDGSVST